MNTYPEEWVQYLVYFHGARDYFECHEVMEAYWKNHPGSPCRPTFLALIQIAVSLYHHRRGNHSGAYKLMSGARSNIRREHLDKLGIDGQGLIEVIEQRLQAFCEDARPPFADICIPIADGRLLEQCRKKRGAVRIPLERAVRFSR